MNIRFYNARILVLSEGHSFQVITGELWVKKNEIIYIGDGLDTERVFEKEPAGMILWDREIDAGKNLLLPGFKNAHTHTAMTFLRSYADDLPLQDWLTKQVFPKEALLTADDIYWLSILGIMEYLTSGITSNFDMYFFPETIAKASIDCGFRTMQVSSFNDFTSSIEEMEEIYHKVNEMSDLTGYVPGFHAEYTCSKELLWKVSEMAHHYRTPVYAHISETEKEVEECKARYGMTPPMFLDSLGMFDYGGGGFHCVHVTDQDLDVFRRHHMYVITNPGSNTKLASGIAPIADYVRHKIPVAIGTDGPASNNCLDMFREMFLVTGLSKLLEKDAASMDAMEVLKMATMNGAKAMRLNRADVLAKGKYADLIMIDLHQPNMQPIHNIPKNLVYSGSKSNVCMTMIGGKILYRNGEFNVGEDPERIYAKCEKIVKRLLTE